MSLLTTMIRHLGTNAPKADNQASLTVSETSEHCCCAMLIREEGNLDPVGEEVVSLKPVLTEPIFV